MNLVKDWFRRNFSDPQVVVLTVLLAGSLLVVLFLGKMLIPVLASLVIAYLLDSVVAFLERRRLPRLAAVLGVYFGFLALFGFALFFIGPLLFRQVEQVLRELPMMVTMVAEKLRELPQHFELVTEAQVESVIAGLQSQFVAELKSLGSQLLAFSVSSVQGLILLFVYLILVPILVFFMLKDKAQLLGWFKAFVPRERRLAAEVWRDVDRQIGNYVRGKALEILIVGLAAYLTFMVLDLDYRLLLSLLVGLSVVVPYIGATVMTFPVAMVAYAQFGATPELLWVVVSYLVLQALDGNVLAPLLFSEVVQLHPIAIISAVLVFGGIWGFWGVFFAIPLATVVQSVIKAWPRKGSDPVDPTELQPG